VDALPEDQHRGHVDDHAIFDTHDTKLAGTVYMKSLHQESRQLGFTLLEVMVSLIIISAGLLGVAKMQALALTNTSVASLRSLAAIEAASLAATMHENRAYWATAAPAANAGGIKITGSGPASTPTITAAASLTASVDCTSGTAVPYCTADNLAAYDLQQWAAAVNFVLPNYNAVITCTGVSPVSCTIAISWQERAVALNDQQAQAQAQAKTAGTGYLQATKAYTLFVEP
jgi:type IV pilus assembly protein PilV